MGIHNGAQLRDCPKRILTRAFGKAGLIYYDFARGIDNRPVEAVRIRKSIGCEHTLDEDIDDASTVDTELVKAAEELYGRLERKGFHGSTLTLKVKFHDFVQITRSVTLPGHEAVDTLEKIIDNGRKLVNEVDYASHPIRLIGLSVSNPRDMTAVGPVWRQLCFDFDNPDGND